MTMTDFKEPQGLYMKLWTTSQFRILCLNKYPALATNEKYRKFFQYLCFSSFYDEETSLLCVPAALMFEEVEGKKAEERDKNYSFISFLNSFKKDVLPTLQVQDYVIAKTNSFTGQCRQVTSNGFDTEMVEALKNECQIVLDDCTDRIVYFVSGLVVDRNSRGKLIKECKVAHDVELKGYSLNTTQKLISDYLHAINGGHLFLRKFAENKNHIFQVMEDLKLSPHKKVIQERILQSIQLQPQPFYKPSEKGNTCRLSNCNDSVVGLKSEIRKAFCKGWTECDLRSSQFAILASVLNAPVSKAFLASGENIWKSFYLHTHGLNEEPPKHIKKVFKEIIYSICFGKSKERDPRVAKYLTNRLDKPIQNDITTILKQHSILSLLEHSIIKELLSLRVQWFNKLKQDGGGNDAFGVFQKIDTENGRWVGAVAASIIQSYEMVIIAPIFEYAIKKGKSDKFGICIFQHDGATMSFYSAETKERVKKNLKKVVEDKANGLGIKTTLDFTDL